MKPIRTERLLLRNWQERDRALFFRINSDEKVMEFFPFRRSRAEADAFMDRLAAGIAARGYGFAAAEIAATGECIGFVGLNDAGDLPLSGPSRLEIGWRLAPEFWCKGYAGEAAKAHLRFAFRKLGAPAVISFAVWNNTRSTAVMERIGMRPDPARDFDHPGVPATHPHLVRHVFYELTRAAWEEKNAARR